MATTIYQLNFTVIHAENLNEINETVLLIEKCVVYSSNCTLNKNLIKTGVRMRILRSQYLQLSNVQDKTIKNGTIGKKVPCYSPSNSNAMTYNSYSETANNNSQNEMYILSQTSTYTTTTTHVRRKSLMISKNEAHLFNSNAVDSKLDDLYGFNGFPEKAIAEQSAPAPIKRRRQTLACPSGAALQPTHPLQIKIDNVPESVHKINLNVEFVDMGPLWLTRLYQSYENDLWQRMLRPVKTNMKQRIKYHKKWHFFCLLCFKKYCKFETLKAHLNNHLELYPYGCKLCILQYTNRSAITRHLRKTHDVERENWNEWISGV